MNYDNLLLSTLSQDAYYLVNKELVRKLGVIPSLTLSLLIDKYKYFKKENKLDSQGGFFLSAKKTKKQINIIEQELKIARSARRTAFDVLKKNNLVKIIKKGNPAQYHYYLNFKSILNILSSGDELTPLSEVETNLSSGDELTPLYNNNKEQKQTIRTKEENSLSYLNLKSKFAEKLKSKNIQYFESRKEYGSISLMQELKIEPQEILDMVDILEAVKKNNPNDKFLQGICFTMSHLVSYRANIYNAQNAAKSNIVTFPKYDLEELRKEGFV